MDDVEAKLEALIRARAFDEAATQTLQAYGPEQYGFLVNLMSGAADAADVFSQTAEDLSRGLPAFRAQYTLRTWMYALARDAAVRYWRSPWNRGGRTGESKLDSLVADARSRTAPWLRTDVKDRWHALREALDPDDQTLLVLLVLLVLRVDRDLSWSDLARVIHGSDDPDPAELTRETAQVRKRFRLLKDELRKRARELGRIEEDP